MTTPAYMTGFSANGVIMKVKVEKDHGDRVAVSWSRAGTTYRTNLAWDAEIFKTEAEARAAAERSRTSRIKGLEDRIAAVKAIEITVVDAQGAD